MTRANKTRSALLTSILSLLLCVSMLVGTTFAWFTDTASTGVNTIKSGNLDIVLEYLNADEKWEEVTKDTLLFNKDALYEPGYTEVAYLRIRNNGSLNLKYTLSVDVANEVTGINKAGQPLKLSDYIQFGTVTSKVNEEVTKYETREAAQAAVTASAKKLQTYTTADYIALAPQEAIEMALVVFMPTTVGNEANHNGVNIPSITMGVSVFATQKDAEEDSYGSTYDQEAPYLEDAEGNVLIADISQLFYFAKQVNEKGNSFSGKTVKLTNDIDLAGYTWTPIGATGSTTFAGTFDGQNHTISNLNINTTPMGRENAAAAGLFGWIENHSSTNPITVKNLTVDGVTVKSGKHAGAVVGYINADTDTVAAIENCTVKNATVSGTRVGGVTGFLGGVAAMTGCKVENAVITGTDSVGEITGYRYATNTYTGNTATNISTVIAGQEAFEQAITDKKTNITLAAGNYTMVGTNYDVTITGTKAAILSLPRNLACTGATIHFKGITVAGDANPDKDAWHTTQLKEAQKATYTDCTVKNLITTYCPSEFTRCVFENNAADQYAVFCYVDGCVFTDCTFNTPSKAIKLFNEGTGELTLTVNGCTFNAAEVDKAAIEIDSEKVNGKYTVHINNCTVNDNYTKLWNDKNTKSEVYVDGKIASAAALESAIQNAQPGDTVTVGNTTVDIGNISENVTIVGNGAENTELTTDVKNGFNVAAGSTISNVTITDNASESAYYAGTVNLKGDNATLKDAVVNAKTGGTWDAAVAVSLKAGETAYITNTEINGGFRGIFLGSQSGDVVIDGCVIKPAAYTISVDGGANFDVTVKNTTLLGWTSYSANANFSFEECKFGSNGSYAFYRPYSATTLTNCDFETGYEIDASKASITLIGCTINGVALTAENAGVLFGGTVPANVTIQQ